MFLCAYVELSPGVGKTDSLKDKFYLLIDVL